MSLYLNLTAALGLVEWSASVHLVKMTLIILKWITTLCSALRWFVDCMNRKQAILKSKLNILTLPLLPPFPQHLFFHSSLSPT